MTRIRFVCVCFVMMALLVLLPRHLFAQSSGAISGLVKDATGGVLPGVTVEASSPALIEKVRTVMTDDQGRYNIVDLRPGTYTVTFTLSGFNSVKREGITLNAGFTANVNADLKVGAVEETVTVSGQAPAVDVQNTRQQTVMTRDIMDTVPAAKTVSGYAVFIPGVIISSSSGVTAQDVGGSASDQQQTMRIHGSRSGETPAFYDGMRYNNMNGRVSISNALWAANNGMIEEYAVQVGSLSIEADASGVLANAIPKAGGNNFRGTFFASYTNDKMISTGNVADATKVSTFPRIWDVNPTYGGPLKQDRLWFIGSFRHWGTTEHPAGAYTDLNPKGTVYTPDFSSPETDTAKNISEDLRLTWQATPRNKFSLWGNANQHCQCPWRLSATQTREASYQLLADPNSMYQLTWNAPVTNKLLIDAGMTVHPENHGGHQQADLVWGQVAPVVEQATGVSSRANTSYFEARTIQSNVKFITTYVTGSHALKVGFQDMWGKREYDLWTLGAGTPTLNLTNDVPTSVTYYTYPYNTISRLKYYVGLFAQDQWTLHRVTLTAGLRFDAQNAYVPAQTYPATAYVGQRSFDEVANAPNWKDINPRFGVAYDLFGNGNTALKASLGRYVQTLTTAYADLINPVVTSVNSTSRAWHDDNHDFYPQCDLKNPAANGECGPAQNQSFGQLNVTNHYDPAFLNGWGKRPQDWEFQTSIQHELMAGLSVNATYSRHQFFNQLAVDNLATSPSDFSSYCIIAPLDPRLPGGGGNQLCGYMDVNPNKFGQVNTLTTFAQNFGKVTDVYNGFDFSVNARLPRGIYAQGGFSSGREVWDNCDMAGKAETPGAGANDPARQGYNSPVNYNPGGVAGPSTLFCHVEPPIHTQVKLLGSIPLPFDTRASLSFQKTPGVQIAATIVVPNAQIAPSLGRNLSGGAANATVQLVPSGMMYEPYLNQLDLRLAKIIRFAGNKSVEGQVDIYNVFNEDAVLGLNTRYGSAWQTPTATLPGRMFKVGMQVNF